MVGTPVIADMVRVTAVARTVPAIPDLQGTENPVVPSAPTINRDSTDPISNAAARVIRSDPHNTTNGV